MIQPFNPSTNPLFLSETELDRRRATSARAFSLVEILVAVAIVAIIIVGLLALFLQVQRAFRGGLAQKDVLEGGRAAMSVLARDLQEMVTTGEGTNFFYDLSVINPMDQPLPGGGLRRNLLQEAAFVARFNDEWIGIAYVVENAADGAGTLLRMVTNAPLTELGGLCASLNVRLSSYANDVAFRPVIDGVVHFRLLTYDPNSLSQGTTNVVLQASIAPGPLGDLYLDQSLPAYLDIELGILEPDALGRWRARQSADAANARIYLEKQAARTHVFRQRVIVRSAASAL